MDDKTIQFVTDLINSMYGFVATDAEGKIVLLGQQYARDLGISVEDAIGKPIEEVIANTEMLDVLKSGKSTWNKFYWAKSGITGDRTPVMLMAIMTMTLALLLTGELAMGRKRFF